jgi:thiol-disulfide isomerase/thioredoxin
VRSLADVQGKVVFVNFWATWCPPCRDEAPSLERLYQRLGPRGLEILAITIDEAGDREPVERFRQELGLTLPILLDPDRDAYRAYQATGVPETFVVSREGRLVERVVGPRDWEEPRYTALVERLLGGDPAPAAGAQGTR